MSLAVSYKADLQNQEADKIISDTSSMPTPEINTLLTYDLRHTVMSITSWHQLKVIGFHEGT